MKSLRIINRLPFRIIAPFIVVLLLAGFGLYSFMNKIANDFVGRIISTNLEERASYQYGIADNNLDQLIKGGLSGEDKSVRIKKAFSLSAIEDDMKEHDLRGAVFQENRTILLMDELSQEIVNSALYEIQADRVTYIRYGGTGYYIYLFEFEPWKWRVYLIKDEAEYSVIINKVKNAYATTGILLLVVMLGFIYYLEMTIKSPLSRIMERIKSGEPPDYKGIYEFEFLSSNIGNIIESLQHETEKLNNIYHIAISKRGEEFFHEVTAATSRMFNMNALIAKVDPGGETGFIISMSFNDDPGINMERTLKGSPTGDVILNKQLLIIERGAYLQFPDAQALVETKADSYACVPVFDRKGEVTGIVNVFGDHREFADADIKMLQTIGQIVAAEFELLEKKASLDNILNSSTDTAIISTDMDYRITYYNPAAEKFFGYKAADVTGLKITDINVIENLEPVAFKMGIYEAKTKGEYRYSYEKKLEGVTHYFDMKVYGMLDEHNRLVGFVFMSRDITSLKQLEEQLLHSRKLEAVGLLAGGVAHEFNNILMAIMGYSSLLAIKTDDTDPRKPYIDNILSSSERAANLTRGLLAFSRKQIINPAVVTLNDIVRKIEKLLRNVIGEDIELRTFLSETNPTVTVDSGQIEQVLMNLATNARDAMPNGGSLTIETESVTIDSEVEKGVAGLEPGEYALLSISDTGIGMNETIREHIFEPFFTSKDVGKGTGLGLSIAFGIIKQHNGCITVASEPDQGSTFRIYLPKSRELPPDENNRASVAAPAGGSETILVVEDDTNVIDLVRDILSEFGYTVICADSENALKVFEENCGNINLLLLDVVMPKKSGREIFEEIRAVNPDIKAIFMSGYSAEIINKRGILREGVDFIPKPISPQTLLTRIRETLDR
jgi:PAS domain S-box-containing protein